MQDNRKSGDQEKPIAGFEKLWVWQKSHKLMQEVHQFCKTMPRVEIFRLRDQVERCSSSVCDNIAEGYTLTQEALNNIAKHSKADLFHLSLQTMENRIELIIKDNGIGFSLEEILSSEKPKKGLGLNSMRERTELSGGTFAIETTTGAGTTIRASWPI